MDTEIELKFLVSDVDEHQLASLIHSYADTILKSDSRYLVNAYFDTPERNMRDWGMALRTRSIEGETEQTIKTAGKSVGGLHRRPEYNFPIEGNKPDLSLFDINIWPDGVDPVDLQERIVESFSTNFTRKRWLVDYRGSEVEIVFDQGDIKAGNQTTPINEIEIELVSGTVDAIFEFAESLINAFSARLGVLSKAARGFQLLNEEKLEPKENIGQVKLSSDDTLEKSFIKAIEYGIGYVQYHEECYFHRPGLSALRRLSDGLALIRHCFWLFSEAIPSQASKRIRGEIKWLLQEFDWVENARQLKSLLSNKKKYRKRVDNISSLHELIVNKKAENPDIESVFDLFSSTRYNLLILHLTRWVIEKRWSAVMTEEQQDAASKPVNAICSGLLAREWEQVRQMWPVNEDVSVDHYIEHHVQLKRNLMTGSCIGSLFDDEARQEFRAPWNDLSHGIDELKTLVLMKRFCEKLEPEDVVDTARWLDNQIEGLMLAMEQSRSMALKIPPYWWQ